MSEVVGLGSWTIFTKCQTILGLDGPGGVFGTWLKVSPTGSIFVESPSSA